MALVDHATFAWDKVCIFGPYTPDGDIDAATGIQGAAAQAHDIRSSDGIDVLMFIHEGRIAASVAHPRHRGDFGPELVGQVLLARASRVLGEKSSFEQLGEHRAFVAG